MLKLSTCQDRVIAKSLYRRIKALTQTDSGVLFRFTVKIFDGRLCFEHFAHN